MTDNFLDRWMAASLFAGFLALSLVATAPAQEPPAEPPECECECVCPEPEPEPGPCATGATKADIPDAVQDALDKIQQVDAAEAAAAE